MATEAQLEANRNNAKLSTGPRTAEGKQRASQNATTHGLYSKSVVLRNENREEFDALAQCYVAKARPADPVELRLVQIMADCDWRMIRSRYVETAILDNQMDKIAPKADETFEQVDEPARLAFAIQNLDHRQRSIYQNAQRQEARLQREYLRSFNSCRNGEKASRDRLCDPPVAQEPLTPIPLFAVPQRRRGAPLRKKQSETNPNGLTPHVRCGASRGA